MLKDKTITISHINKENIKYGMQISGEEIVSSDELGNNIQISLNDEELDATINALIELKGK